VTAASAVNQPVESANVPDASGNVPAASRLNIMLKSMVVLVGP